MLVVELEVQTQAAVVVHGGVGGGQGGVDFQKVERVVKDLA